MLKAKQYFPNYFSTNHCLSIPLSCVLSTHITAAKGFHFYMDSVHMFPEPQTTFPGQFRLQEPPEYPILMCIECAYYSKGKAILSEIFRHQQLPKYSIFMCIDCAYYSQGKTIFSEIFRHQLLPKDFIFTWFQLRCSLSHKQYSPKSFGAESCWNISFLHVLGAHDIPKANQHSLRYFGTNSCRNIPFSCVLSANIIPKAKQYSPKYFGTNNCQSVPFSCVLTAHIIPKAEQHSLSYFGTNSCQNIPFSHAYYSEGKAMLSEIFRHQQLPKYSIFMCINCTYYTESKAIFSEIFRHQRLPKYSIFICINCAYYSEGKTIFSMPKDFIFTWIQCTSSLSHKQYFLGISGPRAAKIFHFSPHYQVHILYWKQTNSCRNITFSCVLSVHITPKAKKYSSKYSGTNSSQNIPFSCVFCAHFIPKAKQYSPKYFGTNTCRNISFSCVLIAHITPKAKQYSPSWKISFSHGFSAHPPGATNNISWVFQHWELPKYFIFVCIIKCRYYTKSKPTAAEILPFHCSECAYYSEGKEIFFEIFRHQQLLKYSISCVFHAHFIPKTKQYSLKHSIFLCIDCTYYSEGKQYSLKYFSTDSCQNISFSHGLSAHVPELHTVFPIVFWHWQLPKYFIFMCIKCTCYS